MQQQIKFELQLMFFSRPNAMGDIHNSPFSELKMLLVMFSDYQNTAEEILTSKNLCGQIYAKILTHIFVLRSQP